MEENIKKCPFCFEDIKIDAVFCKHCKTDLVKPAEPIKQAEPSDPHKIKSNPIMGLIGGTGCGIMLIIVGFLLCFTLVGAIIGIPMILIGLMSPVAGLTAIKGDCPYCNNNIDGSSLKKGVTCRVCKKRVLIKDKKFVRVE